MDKPLIRSGLLLGLCPDEVKFIVGKILILEPGDILHVHAIGQIGEKPQIPAPEFPF